MESKEHIIANIREYSATDIVQAIRQGEITLYELSKSGVLTPLMRKRIEEQLSLTDSTSTNEEKAETIVEDAAISEVKTLEDIESTDSITTKADLDTEAAETVSSDSIVEGNSVILSESERKPFIISVFSFNGRIRRWHYFCAILGFYALLLLGVFFMAELSKESAFWGFCGAVIMFFSFWLLLAARVKRCHDRGNSGWWQLYTCIPYVGVIFSLILLFGRGDEDENEYGMNPRN